MDVVEALQRAISVLRKGSDQGRRRSTRASWTVTQTAVIDAQHSQVWTNRSGWISIKAESQATSDREVNFPVVKQRQMTVEISFEDPDRDG